MTLDMLKSINMSTLPGVTVIQTVSQTELGLHCCGPRLFRRHARGLYVGSPPGCELAY